MLNYEENNKYSIKKIFKSKFKTAFRIAKIEKEFDEICFLCVGTDRITGDCFGPLVGTKLTKLLSKDNFSNVNVFGTLDDNLTYNKVDSISKTINKNSCTIIIDAALSKKENIGKIFVTNSKTVLGKSLEKNKIELGDISIKSVLAKDNKIPSNNFRNLQNISLNTVMNMAEIVSEGIYETIKNI